MRGFINKRSLDVGLMALPGLHRPEDWGALVENAIDRCQKLREETLQEGPGIRVLELIDELSDTICRVADPAEFCRSMHPKPAWREHARGACLSAGTYIANLNADESLLSKLWESMERRREGSDDWTEEAVLVGERLIVDFERGGCSLKGKEVVDLWRKEQEVCFAFDASLSETSQMKDLVVNRQELETLPPEVAALFSHKGGQRYATKVPYSSLGCFSTELPTSELRKRAYMACFQSLPKNAGILDELIRVRMDLARTLQHRSFAHMTLKDNIAGAPEAVNRFLEALSDGVTDVAGTVTKALVSLGGADMKPWDVWRYGEMGRRAFAPTESRFSVSHVVEGLKRILKEAFGVVLSEVSPTSGEIWAPGVKKLMVEDQENGMLGHIYLDLFDREDKFPGSATYTLRCGRLLADGAYQTPIVAMAMRMSSDSIGYHHLKTFLHEFGHALNALLCRTKYQTLFGTRGPLDVVEIPSHFMEFYAKVPELLQILAGSDSNGQLRSIKELTQTIESEMVVWPLALQEQIQWSMVDQAYFGENPCPPGGTSEVLAEIVNKHGVLPFVKGTCRELWHSHFASYGGSYYSYLYARCLAAQIWSKYMLADPLSRKSGEHIKKMMFMPGGALNPQEFVTGILGEGALLKEGNGWMPASAEWLKLENHS
ncbi:hypothetical protein BSKO_06598 [Bryopsis sp. KO-2023]|nr:hypothetical protein BSKO_06598 [Bryopsis sp. KO-2023]